MGNSLSAYLRARLMVSFVAHLRVSGLRPCWHLSIRYSIRAEVGQGVNNLSFAGHAVSDVIRDLPLA